MSYIAVPTRSTSNLNSASDVNQLQENILRTLNEHINGLILSNSATDTNHDITISAGICNDSTGIYVMSLTTAITKQLDAAWAAGTNAGGLDTGSIGAASDYYMWLIRKDSDGTIDALFSLSGTAPTMPAGYTYKRLLDGVFTVASVIINNQFLLTRNPVTRPPYMLVRDEKAANVDGGTFTSGAWQTRTLNTQSWREIAGASINANQIILPAGTYKIFAKAPATVVNNHKARLYNITDSVDVIIGTSEYTTTSYVITNYSYIDGCFTITAQKTFELQHRCNTTRATYGLGISSNLDSKVEVYAEVELWKVA